MSSVAEVKIALAIVPMCLANSLLASPAYANSAELLGITIPAASCVPTGTPAQNTLGVWSLGQWNLTKNGTFRLTCALPVDKGQMTGYRYSTEIRMAARAMHL